MSAIAHIVSEAAARLGDRIADPQAVCDVLGDLRDEHYMAPAAWATIERTLLAMGRRAARQGQGCPPADDAPRPRLRVVQLGGFPA